MGLILCNYGYRMINSKKILSGVVASSVLLSFVLLVSPVSAQQAKKPQARTTTVYKQASGSGGVDVFPYLSGDKKTLFIDFESSNLKNVEYIYYNLNYDTSEEGTLRGAESKIVPDPKEFKTYNGKPYIRKQLLTGTCSKNVCVWHQHPRNIRITVKTKFKNQKVEQTRVYNIEN